MSSFLSFFLFFGIIPDQRHNSEPFVCHENLLSHESTAYFRRGSASLIETCRTRSASKTLNQTSCLCPIHSLSSIRSWSAVHAADYSKRAQSASALSPLLPSHQLSPHDSASRFDSPHTALNLQPPPEVCLSVPHSPRHHPCKACTSLLFKDRTKGGGSLGHTHKRTFVTSAPHSATSLRLLSPSAVTPSHVFTTCPASSPNSQSTAATSPLRHSSPSRVVFPHSLRESGDLSLLNYCLHHIVGRRTSSPTLSDRRDVNKPVHSHRETERTSVLMSEHTDKSRSLDAPVCHTPNLDRSLLSSQLYNKDRADPLVG